MKIDSPSPYRCRKLPHDVKSGEFFGLLGLNAETGEILLISVFSRGFRSLITSISMWRLRNGHVF